MAKKKQKKQDPENDSKTAGELIEMNDPIEEESAPRQSAQKAHSVKSSEASGSKKFQVKIPSAKSSQKATLQKGLLENDDPDLIHRLNTDIMAKEEAYNNYDNSEDSSQDDPRGFWSQFGLVITLSVGPIVSMFFYMFV